jgi:hypothetical protein
MEATPKRKAGRPKGSLNKANLRAQVAEEVVEEVGAVPESTPPPPPVVAATPKKTPAPKAVPRVVLEAEVALEAVVKAAPVPRVRRNRRRPSFCL